MSEEIISTGGWCAPSMDYNALPSGSVVLPEIGVRRGGLRYGSRASMPDIAAPQNCEHQWERENRQGQCDCSQCKLTDPRGLTCAKCTTDLAPGAADFDALYELAPHWWDTP